MISFYEKCKIGRWLEHMFFIVQLALQAPTRVDTVVQTTGDICMFLVKPDQE